LYQYRVDFNPEEDRISTKRGLLAQHRDRLGGYLFDGTMLFSGSRFDPPVSCCIKLTLSHIIKFLYYILLSFANNHTILKKEAEPHFFKFK